MLNLRPLGWSIFALAAALSLLACVSTAEAGLFNRAEPKVKAKPASVKAATYSAVVVYKGGDPIQAPIQAPVQAQIQATFQKHVQARPCKTPCITYKHHCTLRKTCCACTTSHTVILTVEDPCTCCVYEIPVCLPDCCDGEPREFGRLNALGRGAIVYHWCCGYKVKLIFDRCGDVTVHSFGR